MKRGMFTLALAISLFSISCTKDNVELTEEQKAEASLTTGFVSGWENVPTWQSSTSNGVTVFSFKRTTPQLTRQLAMLGSVLVWTKGYDIEGGIKGDKPLAMPFTWIPADERYMHPYQWYYQSAENSIGVGVEMHETMASVFNNVRDKIMMRYFVVSPDFMKAHQLDGPALKKLTYAELVSMLNVAP
jgi:hypothetical protein